jgi:hypothetical protein
MQSRWAGFFVFLCFSAAALCFRHKVAEEYEKQLCRLVLRDFLCLSALKL